LGNPLRQSLIGLVSKVVLGSAAVFLFSCSTSSSGKTQLSAAPNIRTDISAFVSAEPSEDSGAKADMERLASWQQFQSGLQAMENSDWLEAQYYFDLAMDELISEIADSSLALDSVYAHSMPLNIVRALEMVYPRLSELGNVDSAFAMASDMDLLDELVDDSPIDSSERRDLESFLDTLNLNRFSLPVELNDRVMKEIHFLTRSVRGFTEGSLSRKTLFEDMIRAKLRARNMPEDLLYLSFVESGFKTKAYSRAKASGLWQFIPGTGKRYGLDIDYWVDMRRNPELATDAALDYLSALYKDFGDWHLALAAYNCGEGRIKRLLRDSGGDSSYWNLKLPRETMHYVPRILAAMIIGHFPDHYGFKVEQQSSIPFDTVTVDQCLPLENAAKAVGVGVNTIRDLNLELNRWCTPPNRKAYVLRVPQGSRDKFLEEYAQMDLSKFSRWQEYKVRSRDNLARVARKFGLSAAEIRQANNLKGNRLKVGQVLVIPVPVGAAPVAEREDTEEKVVSSRGSRTYVVRKGDNLGAIARKHGVSIQDLKDWNNLADSRINKGQRLNVQPSRKEVASEGNKETAESRKVRSAVTASGETYTVRPGDSYYSIANALGVEQAALMDLNEADDSKLQPGNVLRIPVGEVKVAEAVSHRTANLATDAKGHSYEVRDGDNLYSISRRLGVSLADLQRWNNLGQSTDIRPGQKLLLKESSSAKGASHTVKQRSTASYYKVRSGDNLWDIARKHDVTVKQIKEWNGLTHKKLQPGMRLKVSP